MAIAKRWESGMQAGPFYPESLGRYVTAMWEIIRFGFWSWNDLPIALRDQLVSRRFPE